MSLVVPLIENGQLRRWSLASAGVTLLAVLVSPPLRHLLEGHLVTHLLVQIPMLATAGILFGRALPIPSARRGDAAGSWHRDACRPWDRWNTSGLPGLLLALFTVAFWMLPRSLDAALAEPAMAVAKFISLPVLLGLPLAQSWRRLHPIARGFVWAKLVSMLGVLGWLYLAAPVRLCNFYLLDEQLLLGRAMLAIGAALAAALATQAFWVRPRGGVGANPLERGRGVP
jgi:hypothetical protein